MGPEMEASLRGEGGGKHGAARVRDELPLEETRSKAGPLTGEQKNETKMSSHSEAIRPPLGEAFTIEKQLDSFSVDDTLSLEGTDTLTNVERLVFADGTLAFDTNGNAEVWAEVEKRVARSIAINKGFPLFTFDILVHIFEGRND